MNEAESNYIAFLDVIQEQIQELTDDKSFEEISDDMGAEMMSLSLLIANIRKGYR